MRFFANNEHIYKKVGNMSKVKLLNFFYVVALYMYIVVSRMPISNTTLCMKDKVCRI